MRFVKTAESILNIPSGFTRVEFLESTGTQYIDTGVQNGSELSFYINFNINNTTYSGTTITHFYGSRNQDIVGAGNGTRLYNLSLEDDYFGTRVVLDSNFQFDKYHTIEKNKNITIYDGTTYTHTSVSEITTPQTVKVFGFTLAGGSSNSFNRKMRIKQFRISNNNTLIRDYIPALDPFGVPCMYDLVGKKPYYNKGTGTFTAGRQIIPVEYIESTGTQYIDTGYKPVPATTKFEFYFNPTTISGNYFLFGARPDTSIGGFTCTTYFATGNIRQDWAGLGSYFTKINVGDKVLYSAYNNTVSLNNDSATGTVTRSTDRLDYNFLLFTVNTAGTADSRRYIGRVYYSKLWDDGTLVRDFIPCKDENNVGFMFDTLSGTVYENKGTGAFVVGNNKYKMKLRLIKDNILPTGYTQVEYLESSGTQWIDTGIKGTQDTEIQCGFNVLDYTQTNYISLMGYVGNSNESISVFLGRNSGNGRTRFGNANTLDTAVSLNTRYDLIINKSKLQLNSNVLSWDCTNTFTTEGNLLLFKRNSETYGNFIGRIRCCKIYDNDTPTRDFIPALDPSGTPCMYDLVSRTPFYNAGTGTFTTGKPVLPVVRFVKDIVPAGYKTVNYLESTGTQYIDTGIQFIAEDDYVIKARSVNLYASKRSAIISNYYNNNYTSLTLEWAVGSGGEGKARVYCRLGTGYISVLSPADLSINTLHDLELEYLYSSNKVILHFDDDTTTSNLPARNIPDSTYNWCLFLDKRPDSSAIQNPTRIYYLQIYHNNTLVRNFIPVVRRIDKVAGMWDTVTKQFFTTPVGTFNYG